MPTGFRLLELPTEVCLQWLTNAGSPSRVVYSGRSKEVHPLKSGYPTKVHQRRFAYRGLPAEVRQNQHLECSGSGGRPHRPDVKLYFDTFKFVYPSLFTNFVHAISTPTTDSSIEI